MEKINSSNQFHEVIHTKYVYTEDSQVFMRLEIEDSNTVEWFPTNFSWKPNR
ncbi:hypothetical protein GH721_02295 [Kriegella sp. EG-1]|nr:hypothetical protein [Flavobacteriaceae bacterium EG-1]